MTGGSQRAEAMAARVDTTAEALQVAPEGRDLMAQAFRGALSLRARLHDHHVDYLHTARTALILMDDLGVADPQLLAAALILDTRDPGLAPSRAELAGLDPEVRALLAEVPVPREHRERLLEALLPLPRDIALLALAERLDHARHLHLRGREEWEPEHRVTCGVYAPVAGRIDPLLARRFAWWCRTFERRLRPA